MDIADDKYAPYSVFRSVEQANWLAHGHTGTESWPFEGQRFERTLPGVPKLGYSCEFNRCEVSHEVLQHTLTVTPQDCPPI
jgi:hypothetical protein